MSRVFETMGTMGTTTRIASTDTAAGITAGLLSDASSRRACAAVISIDTASIRVAFNATPTQGASGIGHTLFSGDSWRIVGRENLENLLFISAANGVAGGLQITPEY
jgi:hypothetical protein